MKSFHLGKGDVFRFLEVFARLQVVSYMAVHEVKFDLAYSPVRGKF